MSRKVLHRLHAVRRSSGSAAESSMPTPAATSCCRRCEAIGPDNSRRGAVPNFAFLGKPGVAEIELLQQLEMQGGRYLVERYGQQGPVVAIERGDDRIGAIDRVRRFQQQRPDLGGLCPVHCFSIPGSFAGKLIPDRADFAAVPEQIKNTLASV